MSTVRIVLTYVFFITIAAAALSGCAGVFKQDNKVKLSQEEREEKEIIRIRTEADYEFYNLKMLSKPEEWRGKLISVSGTISLTAIYDIEGINKSLFFVAGANNGYAVRMLIYVDSKLPTETHVSEQKKIISNGSHIRVFGTLMDLKEVTGEDGVVRKYPMLRTSLIYLGDDRQFRTLMWKSKALGLLW